MTKHNPPFSFPERSSDAHKGTFGTSLIIAGSRGMSGAAILAGKSALRGGSGLVRIACPESCLPVIAGAEPAYMTVGLHDDSAGQFSKAATLDLTKLAEEVTAAGIGPGIGQSHDLDYMVARIYQSCEIPLVVDADALNSLARQGDSLKHRNGPRILTPHPGEMARLLNCSSSEVQDDRETAATTLAQNTDSIVVLKGYQTIVTDGEQTYQNETGNPGLATGGTGDVLTGLIVSLLAQKMSPYPAACLAVYLHGYAADLAAEKFGQVSLISSDLPEYIACAIKSLASSA